MAIDKATILGVGEYGVNPVGKMVQWDTEGREEQNGTRPSK